MTSHGKPVTDNTRTPKEHPPLLKAIRCYWVLLVLASLLFTACASPKGWVLLDELPDSTTLDDGNPQQLTQAIDQSINYYSRLPRGQVFTYGKLKYTVNEMVASMLLFRTLVLSAENQEDFLEEISDKFHVFESISENSENLFTGYYEPTIPGSRTPKGRLSTPLYKRPENLIELQLNDFYSDLPSRRIVGRVEGKRFVPYYTRKEITKNKALSKKAEPLAYVDQVDLFFLQIQGSGVVRFPDGEEIKVGYDDNNGHPYRSIGAELLRDEIIPREEISLQSIKRYLQENPKKVNALLFKNPSYTFFQVKPDGPLGNIQVPLTPGRSIALDHRRFPKGSLAYIITEVPMHDDDSATLPLRRFVLVQDTGGAIKGHGRADVFWGNGEEAEWAAGHQKHTGRLLLLVARKKYLTPYLAKTP